jgi:probable rRNA maturation factor
MSSEPPEQSWYFENRQRKIAFDESAILAFIACIAKNVAAGAEFAVVVSNDDAVRGANRRFRGISRTTDVLSFPDGDDGRLGDVLISAPRAQRQAETYGHAIDDELKVLTLHGLLHLLGYDHETDQGEMNRVEKCLRRRYKLPTALSERAAA